MHEDHPSAFGAGLTLQFRQLVVARSLALALDGDLSNAVGIGEVAPGRMEDEEGLTLRRFEDGAQFEIEGIEFLLEGRQRGGQAGVEPRRRLAEGLAHGSGLLLEEGWRGPDVGIASIGRADVPRRAVALVVPVVLPRVMPVPLELPQSDPFAAIDHPYSLGAANRFEPAPVLERQSHGEVERRPHHLAGLLVGGLIGLVALPRGDHGGHSHVVAGESLEQESLGSDAHRNRERPDLVRLLGGLLVRLLGGLLVRLLGRRLVRLLGRLHRARRTCRERTRSELRHAERGDQRHGCSE